MVDLKVELFLLGYNRLIYCKACAKAGTFIAVVVVHVASEKEVLAYKPNLDELEHYNKALQESLIFENQHTPYTMEVNAIV